ncbi:hypothetical protein BP6252_07662 [Coleophoma cylindrospora]|uniref:Epoxide hydrolase N-terminal domain-containing protein n=1 Tax=Coleophoma cylindrospora TaxID=1849047 RepID=A0A3D8RAM0_9HELO|nr:hypothetical protein BP6252_07662 [Coleophoma cylindrospora]
MASISSTKRGSDGGHGSIEPFKINISQAVLDDLQAKLKSRRLPGQPAAASPCAPKAAGLSSKDNGVATPDIEGLAKYWLKEFDWRAQEEQLNSEVPQYKTHMSVAGEQDMGIHFLWEKSQAETAVPLLMVHGWPSSPFEFGKIIQELAHPQDAAHPSFHCVAPSLPGHVFSDLPKGAGFGIMKTGEVFHALMQQLGYKRYFGSFVCRAMALQYPEAVRGTHQNMVLTKTPSPSFHTVKFFKLAMSMVSGGGVLPGTYSRREVKNLHHVQKFVLKQEMGYNQIMSTKPLTVSYGLTDSPVGLLAWIWEKLDFWTDEYPWTQDEILRWTMLYWIGGIYGSAQLYKNYQVERDILTSKYCSVPIGVSLFEGDLFCLPGDFASMVQPVHFFREHARGGHFPAYEQPGLLLGDIREYIGKLL